jgi:hypothetical protein
MTAHFSFYEVRCFSFFVFCCRYSSEEPYPSLCDSFKIPQPKDLPTSRYTPTSFEERCYLTTDGTDMITNEVVCQARTHPNLSRKFHLIKPSLHELLTEANRIRSVILFVFASVNLWLCTLVQGSEKDTIFSILDSKVLCEVPGAFSPAL